MCLTSKQLELSPQWALPLISQPEVNFTACNLHMFIYRNLISVISDSLPATCSSAQTHMHAMIKTRIPTLRHTLNEHIHPQGLGVRVFLFKFKANYIVADWIHSVYVGNCWLILKRRLWEEGYFSKRHWWLCIDIHFQKGPASKRIWWLCGNYVGLYSILQNCTAFPLKRELKHNSHD